MGKVFDNGLAEWGTIAVDNFPLSTPGVRSTPPARSRSRHNTLKVNGQLLARQGYPWLVHLDGCSNRSQGALWKLSLFGE